MVFNTLSYFFLIRDERFYSLSVVFLLNQARVLVGGTSLVGPTLGGWRDYG